jgi:TetR/AcrR family transcriptional repressor of nem operon
MMIGAVTLARATRGNELSGEFLEAARNALLPVDSLTPATA